ncbi:polysaccharide deacetylase family protein [Vineibacter terrae]|uniref:polysaccharide deacetylase family protein n=1 Tax=Vineibacter terrae TaxID=2586908 RepID=UPI002E3205D8|nr:polysaccharide deacetylase family protein [Vineibacter terrae]HEX2886849.1 polysaccharide deacetylase family protein [Vineibacter terrae]
MTSSHADARRQPCGPDPSPKPRSAILHVDDVGMCHGANRAFLELARAGAITSGSVMVPCPWFPEIAEAAAADRGLDLGVHLTLTAEWPHYRWRPISTSSPASGLLDDDGYFPRNCAALRRRVVPEAAAIEMRAQIDRALAAGIDVTHIDTHMGAAFAPGLLEAYLQLGRDYDLPILLPRDLDSYFSVLNVGDVEHARLTVAIQDLDAAGRPVVDTFRMTPGVPSSEVDAAYRSLLTELPPGLTYVALHCNAPGDIEAIVPPRAHWRTDEHHLFGGGRPRRWMEEAGIAAVGFRTIRDRHRARSSPPKPAG